MSSSDPYRSFGGGSYDAQFYADLQYYAELLETHMPDHSRTDYGIAMFLLVLSSVLLVVFSFAMVVFFLQRNVFEIRARSPLLVLLAGACMMVALPLSIMAQRVVIFDATLDVGPYICAYYFILVCSTSCYGSRTIRLAVVFNARARKAVPWLTSEKTHVVVCLLLGVAALGFPLYDLHDIPDGPFADLLFFVRSMEKLWRVTIACQAVALVLWAFNWKTDDIFNIAVELRTATVSQLLVTLAGKLAEDHLRASVSRWINRATLGLLAAIIVFYVSVGVPIRRLLFHPLESSDPKVAEALARRKQGGGTFAMRDCEASTASSVTDSDIAADLVNAPNVIWVYEKVAKIPEISAAFDEFSRKALCQESVLFLKAVTSYQSRNDGGWEASADGNDDKYSTFAQIVLKYIMDGAPDEVNLSAEDKSDILKVHNAGRSGFDGLEDRERRFVFARAYAEVRYIVETNLMTRFVSSDGFKEAARLAGTAGRGDMTPTDGSLGTGEK